MGSLFVCDATRITMNKHELFINIFETNKHEYIINEKFFAHCFLSQVLRRASSERGQFMVIRVFIFNILFLRPVGSKRVASPMNNPCNPKTRNYNYTFFFKTTLTTGTT